MLKELGNIGAGNASTALSVMLGDERVNMYVPEVAICPLSDIPDMLGGADEPVMGVFIKAPGAASFYTVFLITFSSAQALIKNLTGHEYELHGDMGHSVLLEVANIITASYLNALSYMTNLTFIQQPPLLAVDMAGAILGTVLVEANVAEDYVLVLQTAFATAAGSIEGSFLIIPDQESLDSIVSLLLEGACQ